MAGNSLSEIIVVMLYSRNVLQREALQLQFERDGFVVVPWLDVAEVAHLRAEYARLKGDLNKGFHATMHSHLPEYRRAVSKTIADVFVPKADRVLNDYVAMVGNYTVKEPGPDSFFDFHLDWSMVDEKQHTSITIWCPLEDVNAQNGNLWMMKGSNHMGYSLRGGPGLFLYLEDSERAAQHRFEKVILKLKAGEAVIYDHRVFHGSPPNLTEKPRLAINLAMRPKEAQNIHYHQIDDETVELYACDPDFYNRYIIGTVPEGAPSLGLMKIKPNYWYQEQINALCPNYEKV